MIVWLAACAASPDVVVRIGADDAQGLAWLQAHPEADVWTEHAVDFVDVRVPAVALRDLHGAVVQIPDVGALIAATAPLPTPSGPFDDWAPLAAIDDHLAALDALPHAERVTIGTSLEGRPIRALSLSTGHDDDRIGILVVGAQHAREWVSASAALYVADRLATGYGSDPEATDLLDRYDVVVVPVANPDGYEHTWTVDRLWRKNRRDNGDGSVGVDLNRNWDAAWGAAGAADLPISDNWPGVAPFSEPETAALAAFLGDHPRIGLHLDLHCTGQVVLHPWGFTAAPAPDADAFDAASEAVAAAMTAVHGAPYRSGAFHEALYPAYGVAIDWSYGIGGRTSVLFELRDRGQYGFLLPADQLVPTAEEAWAGLVALAADPPRPHPSLDLRGPVVAGARARVALRRLVAGEAVDLYGSTAGPGETVLDDGGSVLLDDAVWLGAGTAAANGALGLGFRVDAPTGAALWLQARTPTALSGITETTVQ